MRIAIPKQRRITWQIGIVLYVEWVLLYTLWVFNARASIVWQKASDAWQACSESISIQTASLQCDRISEEVRRGVDYQEYLLEPFFRSLISGALTGLLIFVLCRLVQRPSGPVKKMRL